MATKKRERRPRQTYLAGAEPISIPALDDAADEYHRLKTERMDLTEQEKAAKEAVKALMVENKVKKYKTPSNLECVWVHEAVDDVSVKVAKGTTVSVNGQE